MGNIHPNSVIQPTFFRKSRAIAKAEAKESLRPGPLHIVHLAESEAKLESLEEKKDPSGMHLFAPLKLLSQKLNQTGLQEDGSIIFPEDDGSIGLSEGEVEASAQKVLKKHPHRAANAQETKARAKNARAKKARAKKAAKKAIRVRRLEAKLELSKQDKSKEKKQKRRFDHPAIKKSH